MSKDWLAPWVDRGSAASREPLLYRGDGERVDFRDPAVARLIAAAPSMYELLKKYVSGPSANTDRDARALLQQIDGEP